jgi:hypothetical protein
MDATEVSLATRVETERGEEYAESVVRFTAAEESADPNIVLPLLESRRQPPRPGSKYSSEREGRIPSCSICG